MLIHGRRARTFSLLGIAVVCFGSLITAQDEPTARPSSLPDAKELIGRMIEASGGSEALGGFQNRVLQGSVEIVGMGISADFTSWVASGGLAKERVSIPEMGNFDQGIHAGVVWAKDPMQGPRLLEGAERELFLRGSRLSPLLHVGEDFTVMKVSGVEKVRDKDCYKLELTPKVGKPEIWFVDRESMLQVRTTATMESPMGTLQITSDLLDYREVDGVQLPFRFDVDQGMTKMELKVKSYEHNVEIPGETFDLPTDVQALVDKKKEKADPPESGSAGE